MPTDERCLRQRIHTLDDETLIHQASRQLRREVDERAARLGVERARERRDKSAARVAVLLSWLEDCRFRSTARDARIVDGRERWQSPGSSVLRVGFRVGLAWSLFALFVERASPAVLIPLVVLWVALVLPERP